MKKCFSHKTIEALGYYVYIYSDPDAHPPFYVGKGKNNRDSVTWLISQKVKKSEK